jgi:hypothetical protein
MADIWSMVKHRKGRPTTIFPPLRDVNRSAVEKPEDKAKVFHNKFFPSCPTPVPTHHPTDPPPKPARQWDNISGDEVTAALATASNSSAPGPSGIGYKILKWAHAAKPDIIPSLLTLCLHSGTHLWKTATVVMLNKPKKPDYGVPKAY